MPSLVDTYLGRAPRRARSGRIAALEMVALFLAGGAVSPAALPWQQLGVADAAVIRSWLVAAYEPPAANRSLTALRALFREVLRSGLAESEEVGAVQRRLGRYGGGSGRAGGPGDMDLECLLAVCEADESPAGPRDAAVVALMAGLGLGAKQVTSLQRCDYDRDGEVLDLPGTPARWRADLGGTQAAAALGLWIDIAAVCDGPLFLALDGCGLPLSSRALTTVDVSRLLRERCRQGGFTPISPQEIKAGFLERLRRRTRRTWQESTGRYGRGEDDQPFVAFRAFDPRSGKLGA